VGEELTVAGEEAGCLVDECGRGAGFVRECCAGVEADGGGGGAADFFDGG